MATLQNSETNLACRQELISDSAKGLGLSQAPVVTQTSNIMRTKLEAGVNGTLIILAQSLAGTCTLKLKADATDAISFAGGTTDVVVAAATPVWGELPINGDTLLYWGIQVNAPVGLTWNKLCVLECSDIDVEGGENYHVASAAFNAKKTVGSGAVLTAWS